MEVERRETLESCKSWFRQESEEEAVGFSKSLQELRDLRSQLHYAADYCETTFLNSPEKKVVVENTQEYICRAVVTIVDHLGRVSSNLNDCFFNDNHISDTQLRIQCLKQRLLSCQTYNHKLALARLQWDPDMPRYHTRYISKQTSTDAEKLVGITRDSYHPNPAKVNKTEEGVPLFLYTCTHKPALVKSSSKRDASSAPVLPVRDGLSGAPNPAFHFQATQKRGGGGGGRNLLNRKAMQGADHILSLIRRTKRGTLNQN